MQKPASRLLFVGTQQDKAYLPRLKGCIGAASCAVILDTPTTLYELAKIAEAKNADAIISTSASLLQKLVNLPNARRKPSIDNYAGSIFKSNSREILFLNPLEQLISVPYGQFLTTRYISKLVAPSNWMQFSPFNWEILTASNAESIFERYRNAYAIAIDIETFSEPPSIRCVGYTACFPDGSFHSTVIPCDSTYNLAWIRKFNWDLQATKVFQNGKYDVAYLSMYNAVPYNYLWDTATLFHSWYSELPKDLASLNSFCVRDSMYWKDLADTSDLHTYYLYNAKDTYATLCVFLSILREMPQWAMNNYSNEFPLLFPCHMAEMTGIRRDVDSLKVQCKEVESSIESKSKSLDTMLAVKNFNVNSPVQMKQLLTVLGCKDLESADAKNLAKAKLRHPLNARIINTILSIRKERKLVSTYLTPGKEYRGRILYSLNPHGTDTGRLASKEHHFWCGLQVQNIPRGPVVKRTFIADDGFRIAECDLEQAESRDTAHIAGDNSLINAVSGTRDFHSVNASAFFGLPYDTIYDDNAGKSLDKALRDLAKRVNHGANYNMGPGVLVETMGEDKIEEAARLLKLPKLWSYKQIAEYLLQQFHKTYPAISKIYYPGVIHEVTTTKMLSSKATHDVSYQASTAGLVRYCFSDPSKSKSALNAYVAHPPQSLNAMTLNKAFMRVFYEIALPHHRDFKLLAQIHDSILFQFREGCEELAEKVKACMEIPVSVCGYDGETRTFTVPAALKAGADGRGSKDWGSTE
jgi:DNA polymerase I-like protein with 3'-5' exonuclease and polymerase domains